MERLHWTWAEIQATPAIELRRLSVYMAVTEARRTGGMLDLPTG